MIIQWLRRLFGRTVSTDDLRAEFEKERLALEERFFHSVATSGMPRGLNWKSIEWEKDVLLARDRKTGHVVALLGITIAFEAVAGSDMEDLPAVGNLRQASALFVHEKGAWRPTARVLFNLGPEEVLIRSAEQFERLQIKGEDSQ